MTDLDESFLVTTCMTRERETENALLPDGLCYEELIHVRMKNGVPTAWVENHHIACEP